jgi:RNA polymerase sigma-70 factor (ECF subfamily)
MNDTDERSDAALIAAVRAGDERAFTQLMRRHKQELYRFVRAYSGDASEAFDLVQESFVAAWSALSRYDPQRPFGIWLKRIALNKCRDWRRRRAVRHFFYRAEDINKPGVEIAQPPPASGDRETEWARLDKAIAALPGSLKAPLLLSLTDTTSYREIGDALGLTAKAVEVRIYRAKRMLAETLGAGPDTDGETR